MTTTRLIPTNPFRRQAPTHAILARANIFIGHGELEERFVRLGISPPRPVGVADWDTAILLAEPA